MSENKDDFRVVRRIKATDTIHNKGLEESYMVSYRVARTGKPHTIVEDFILPAVVDVAGTMLGERPKKIYRQCLHQTALFHFTSVMAGDVLKQLLFRIQASEFYALQLDESTTVASLAQLLLYVLYVYGGVN